LPLLSISRGLLCRLDLIDGRSIGFAEIENWKFVAPVFFSDTVRVIEKVSDLIPSRSKPERGILKLFLRILNQDDKVVQKRTEVLVMKRKPTDH
jgi:acyl dehydratase